MYLHPTFPTPLLEILTFISYKVIVCTISFLEKILFVALIPFVKNVACMFYFCPSNVMFYHFVTISCILFYNKWIDFTALCCAACQSVQTISCQSLTRKVLWDSLMRNRIGISLCVVTLASHRSGIILFFYFLFLVKWFELCSKNI